MTANRKVTARYAEIARFLGLHFNEEFCVAYGEKDGFTLRVSGLDTGRGIEYGMVCISATPTDMQTIPYLILAGVSSTVWSAYQSVWLRTA